jgi:hypothetical protein
VILNFGKIDMNSVSRVVTVVLGVAIVGSATLSEVHCVGHSQSRSCEDPRSPPPQLPDQIPAVTQTSTAPSIVTVISTAPVA